MFSLSPWWSQESGKGREGKREERGGGGERRGGEGRGGEGRGGKREERGGGGERRGEDKSGYQHHVARYLPVTKRWTKREGAQGIPVCMCACVSPVYIT